jgi:hypothetical protein
MPRSVGPPQLPLSFFNILNLSEHYREKVEPMSTVTSADCTTIDYDAYGIGPTVILIGGTTQHGAIDQRTTEIAKQLAAEGFTAVDYDRRGARARPIGRHTTLVAGPRGRGRRGLDRSHRSARRPLHKLLRRRNRTRRGDREAECLIVGSVRAALLRRIRRQGAHLRPSCLSWLGSCARSPRNCQRQRIASHNGGVLRTPSAEHLEVDILLESLEQPLPDAQHERRGGDRELIRYARRETLADQVGATTQGDPAVALPVRAVHAVGVAAVVGVLPRATHHPVVEALAPDAGRRPVRPPQRSRPARRPIRIAG